MIDEEFYRQAADELDSERRRPQVWARACALADDDHDEARYLYTNLRVEELLAEAERGGEDGGVEESGPSAPLETSDDEPAPEPIEFEPLPDVGDGRVPAVAAGGSAGSPPPAVTVDDAAPRPTGARPRLSSDLENDATLDPDPTDVHRLDDAGGAAASATVAEAGGETLGRRAVEDGPDGPDGTDGEPDPRSEPHETLFAVVETVDSEEVGVDDTVALDPARPIPGRADGRAHPLDDLDWLDEARREPRASPAAARSAADVEDDGDPLTRELRRQADELPDGGPAIIAHETSDTLPVRRVGHDAVDAERGVPPGDARPGAAASDVGGAFALTDGPLEITDERGGTEEFAVFVDAAGKRAPQAVRQGGSWGALVATVPWLLGRRLVGTAIVYVLFAAVVLAGLAATGLAWSEAGESASMMTRGATVGFALLALIGLVVVPFRNANHWREDKLERRGFDLVAYVRTRDRERAVALARDVDGRRPTG